METIEHIDNRIAEIVATQRHILKALNSMTRILMALAAEKQTQKQTLSQEQEQKLSVKRKML
jgi:hypothetical protein